MNSEQAFQALLEGRYDDIPSSRAALSEMPADLFREICSHRDFHLTRVKAISSQSWLTSLAWWTMSSTRFGYHAVTLLLSLLGQALSAVGLRQAIYLMLRNRNIEALIHNRYMNFKSGLLTAALLHGLCPRTRRFAVDRNYIMGLKGHFAGMCGRYDLGLDLLRKSVAVSEAPKGGMDTNAEPSRPYLYYLEILAILALHETYAGYHGNSRQAFDRLFACLAASPYLWIEMFARTMRLHYSMESLDQDGLFADTKRLKSILGEKFDSKFGLRTSAYGALIAAINGDFYSARSQLINSESYYESNTVSIERSRYHFVRALTELELGQTKSALQDAHRARSYLVTIPGARFHRAEATLLNAEIVLRCLLMDPDLGRQTEIVRTIKKDLAAVAHAVHGAPGISLKIKVLRILANYVAGDFEDSRLGLATYKDAAQRTVRRFSRLLDFIDYSSTAKHALVADASLIRQKGEFGTIDLMILLNKEKDLGEGSCRLLQAIFAAESCVLNTSPCLEAAAYQINETADDETRLSIFTGRERLEFHLRRALNRSNFDTRLTKYLDLAVAMIQTRAMEKYVLESERYAALGKAAQMMAHDVRKPFSRLQLGVERILRSDDTTMRQVAAEVSLQVETSLRSVNSMISDVLCVGAEGHGSKTFSLASLLDDVLSEQQLASEQPALSLRLELKHGRYLHGDEAKVSRVLANLVQNAIHATGASGAIWIRSEPLADDPGFCKLWIGNSGSFIDESLRHRIFEAFYTEKKDGTGLGLTIAKNIVELHGGDIGCLSSRENGTEFWLTLPLSEQPDTRAQNRNADCVPPRAASTNKIAIVDDDIFIRQAWAEKLVGLDIEAFDSPRSFWRKYANDDEALAAVSCVLTDYDFGTCPGGSETGVEFARALKGRAAIPILLSTDMPGVEKSRFIDAVIAKTEVTTEALTSAISSFKD